MTFFIEIIKTEINLDFTSTGSASDTTKIWASLPGMEGGKNLFSSHIQVFIQFLSVCWRGHAFQREEENTCMVCFISLHNVQIELLYFTVDYCLLRISPLSVLLSIERCDRILWYGNGLSQLSYVRGESRFSDHRPVYSIFMAEVEIARQRKKNMGYFSSRIEVEELLPHSRSYRDINFY
jgi:hypothetical protein